VETVQPETSDIWCGTQVCATVCQRKAAKHTIEAQRTGRGPQNLASHLSDSALSDVTLLEDNNVMGDAT
jgi:hypothetical protein